jgi:hypothetical protein
MKTCKENKHILLRYPIIVFTDHKIMRFALAFTYGDQFQYLPGMKKVVAMPCLD